MNVANAKSGSSDGLGVLGHEQLDWLKKDVAALAASTPVVVFAHVPLWAVYEKWGWGTKDAEQALALLTLRLGHGAERPHPPDPAKGRRQGRFPHGPLDGVPARRAGERAPGAHEFWQRMKFQDRSGQRSFVEIRAGQLAGQKAHGGFERSAFQIRAFQVGADQTRFLQIGADQAGVAQVCQQQVAGFQVSVTCKSA